MLHDRILAGELMQHGVGFEEVLRYRSLRRPARRQHDIRFFHRLQGSLRTHNSRQGA